MPVIDELEHFGVKGMRWGVRRKRGKTGRVGQAVRKEKAAFKEDSTIMRTFLRRGSKAAAGSAVLTVFLNLIVGNDVHTAGKAAVQGALLGAAAQTVYDSMTWKGKEDYVKRD